MRQRQSLIMKSIFTQSSENAFLHNHHKSFKPCKIKGKNVLVYNIKTYWGADVWLHAFLTLATDGGEWSYSCTRRFTPGDRALGTH